MPYLGWYRPARVPRRCARRPRLVSGGVRSPADRRRLAGAGPLPGWRDLATGAAVGGRSGGRRRLGPDRADVAGEPPAARPARGRARRHGPDAGRCGTGRCRCPDGRLAGHRRQPAGRSRPGGGDRHRPARCRTGGTSAHRSRRSGAEQVRGRRRRRRELAARARGRRPAPPPRAGRWLVGGRPGAASPPNRYRFGGMGRKRDDPGAVAIAAAQPVRRRTAAHGRVSSPRAGSRAVLGRARRRRQPPPIGAALDHRRPARPARAPRSRHAARWSRRPSSAGSTRRRSGPLAALAEAATLPPSG